MDIIYCGINFKAHIHPSVNLTSGTIMEHCKVVWIEAKNEEEAKNELPEGYVLYKTN